MSRLILTTILITVVFSWEDLKRCLVWLARRFRKPKHPYYHYNPQIDQIVGTILILATVPANLVYLLLAEDQLFIKLLMIFAQLLFIGLLAELVEIAATKGRGYRHSEILTTVGTLLVGAFNPALRSLATMANHRRLFGAYLRHLSIPILFGLFLKLLAHEFGADYLQTNLDPLIILVIAAMLMIMTIEILEKFFRRHPLRLFSYVRIVVGIILIFLIGNNFV